MAVRKRRLKLLWVFLSVVLLLVLAVAALPWWFPWTLRPIAKRFGASYADYHRVGYQRFRVDDLALTNGATGLQADHATAFVPTVWLWRHLTGAKNEPFVAVQSWRYNSLPARSAKTNSTVSAYSTFGELRKIAATLNQWLPTATLSNGIVAIPNHPLEISQAVWENGNLTATVSISNHPPLTVLAATARATPWKISLDSEPSQFHSTISLDDREGKLALAGSADWLTNHFELAAAFPAHGYMPETATVRGDALRIPARLLGLPQYGDATGSLHAQWQSNRFNVQFAAKALPQGTNLPPLDVELLASGDTNAAQLDVARISAPGLHAELAAPVAVSFSPPYLSRPATLDVTADLEQQHWFLAQGRLAGRAVVSPGEKLPRVAFALSGAGVTTTSVTSSNLELQGELDWPLLDLKSAHVVMDDSSRISVSGQIDLEQKLVRDGRLESSGAFGGQFLPADYAFASASVAAQFSGPLRALTNSGTASIRQLIVPGVRPLDIEAQWSGEGLNFKNFQTVVRAGDSSLQCNGSASLTPKEAGVRLTTLELSQSNRVELQLQQPAALAFSRNPANGTWNLHVEPLVATGENREARLAADVVWPERAAFQCDGHGLDAWLLKDFIPQANTAATLNDFGFTGGWTNGPVTFQLTADASLRTKEQFPFSANARLSGDRNGIVIEQLSVTSATQMVCRAEGTLAVSFDPARRDGMMQLDASAPLKLQLRTDPNSILWEKIAEATGLRLEEPDLAANLEGTWAAPKGQITMHVQRIELKNSRRPLPAIENLDVLAEMDRVSAHVSRFNFDVEKQPVIIQGDIPLGETFWSGLLRRQRLPDWREATGHLQIHNAQLAAFATFLPQILSAEGALSADISLARGGNLSGELSVANARTHSLESIGPVRNIQVLARLEGRRVRLENASGEIGGQRVSVDGSMEINEQLLRTNGLPPFIVHVVGTNVPLARNPSVLLRADLDLAATNSGSEIPAVYGTVKLRDSLFLADLQTLVPERTSSPRRRPPYFSIEAEPWAHWGLKVNVRGDSFLRVQTPLFHGKVSTVLTLSGTMKDPVALGQVRIDPGSTVSFPFSTLDVQQGLVSLTSEDPYEPHLFLTAGSRLYSYDVKLEVTGPVDQPVLQFSSIPSLSSEEIVLMVTAGQIPRGLGVTATTQQRAQGLAMFVGKNLLSDFGVGGSGAERLTLRSGQEISQSGRPTYEVEYKLTDRWSVIGEYDRFDQYNLNLKWKVYSK
jgi:translocation and assembly module TamB